MQLSLLLPGRRAKRDFVGVVESYYNQKMPQEARDDSSCNSFALGMKDLSDYAEKNFGKEYLVKNHLKAAYNLCSGCQRTEKNNCDEVFRRLGRAKDYLVV